MSFLQYLRDTRSELNHVAWPTRTQTIIFTSLVIGLSILVSLYLGIFDYVFTTVLSEGLNYLPQSENTIQLNDLQISTSTPEAPVEDQK